MKIIRCLGVALAALFYCSVALGQNAGTVTNHAYAIGKGAGQGGYTSLLCGSAQLAVGQAAADPICQTITGDVTVTAGGVTGIGATKVLSAMLGADVFSTAHTWSGQQTFVAPILGTPASGVGTNLTGTALGLTAGNVTTNANLTGPVTSVGNATSIGANQVTRAMEAQGAARSVIGVTGNATANVADIQGTANQVLAVNSAGTALAFGAVNLASSAAVTGTLPVANGGTNDTGTAYSQTTPTPGSGTLVGTSTVRVKTLGKTVFLLATITVTSVGTGTGNISVASPIAALNPTACSAVNSSNGSTASVGQITGSTVLYISTAGTLAANTYLVQCTFESA